MTRIIKNPLFKSQLNNEVEKALDDVSEIYKKELKNKLQKSKKTGKLIDSIDINKNKLERSIS